MSDIAAAHCALLQTLHDHQVRFVVIGGVALQLHGYSASTRDLDVTIATDEANARRLDAALSALDARPYLAGDRGVAYHTRHGQLEVMRFTTPGEDYDAWARDATTVAVGPDLHVLVGDPPHLVAAKERAGRDKDIDALPQIRAELLANGALTPQDIHGPIAPLPVPVERDPTAVTLLGPRPQATRQRELWDHAAELIGEYRERWAITTTQPPLGAAPAQDSRQAQDLRELQRQLERLQRLIDRGLETDLGLSL